jgi:hypothetical protein
VCAHCIRLFTLYGRISLHVAAHTTQPRVLLLLPPHHNLADLAVPSALVSNLGNCCVYVKLLLPFGARDRLCLSSLSLRSIYVYAWLAVLQFAVLLLYSAISPLTYAASAEWWSTKQARIQHACLQQTPRAREGESGEGRSQGPQASRPRCWRCYNALTPPLAVLLHALRLCPPQLDALPRPQPPGPHAGTYLTTPGEHRTKQSKKPKP